MAISGGASVAPAVRQAAPRLAGRPTIQPQTVRPLASAAVRHVQPGGGDLTGLHNQTANQAPTTAPGSVGTGSAQATPSTPSALDSTYFANVAANQAKINSQVNSLNLQQGNALTSLQAQLASLQHQQPLDQLHLMEGANARGGLYSTVYDQNAGNLAQSYLDRQSAANDNYGRTVAAIAAKIAGLQGSEPLYENQQAADATGRAAAAAAKNPAVGQALPAPKPAAAPAPKLAARPTIQPRTTHPVAALAKALARRK